MLTGRGNDNHVKMNDVICDIALRIACKTEENFLVYAGVLLTEAPKIEEWEGIKRLSFMDNNITRLSIPSCACVLTSLYRNKISMTLMASFNLCLSSVLNLGFSIFLTKLPSGLSSMISLEHLDLSFTVIRELPEEMKVLVNLRYLKEYVYLKKLPLQLLCNFLKLRALKMLGCSNYSGKKKVELYLNMLNILRRNCSVWKT